MIRYIKGTLLDVTEDSVIIDRNGLGFEVFVTQRYLGTCGQKGAELRLHTFLNVREDDISLFGFPSADELSVYKLLIRVSGIGPKVGLNVLSTLTPDEIRMAVCAGDVKAITKAPGVGKKTAEKLIIELKDKLSLDDVLKGENDAETSSAPALANTEAVEALISLGYSGAEALKAVAKTGLDESADVEDVLKAALKQMAFM